MPDNILFSNSPGSDLKKFLETKKYSSVCIIADDNTTRFCLPLISDALPNYKLVMVPSGEEHKNLSTCELIWQGMTDHKMDRHAVAIVLGGGVLGDMGGFCASTYKRGIDFILIPTTLLSQVDASIGGKLGVDFNNFKNHIGVFQVPALTLLHSGFLKTLPEAERRSGFAEIIKHTLISDAAMWSTLKANTPEQQDWNSLIRHSVEFKAYVVKEDPKESGLRKILNAGHTIGHAIETFLLSTGRKIMHGEAVAAGLIAENYIAKKRMLLPDLSFQEINRYILSVYGKVVFNVDEIETIASLTLQDKKNKGNKILCVLLDGIGKAKWDVEISLEDVKDALAFYQSC